MAKLSSLSEEDKQINTKIYDEYHRLNMVDGWYGSDKLQNYKQMMNILELTDIPLDGLSCLDVGCGSGDLSNFVRKLGATGYIGIDIYQPAIERAKQKYPQEAFILGDFLEVPIKNKFDYAFCSGSLTVKIATDNYVFLEATVAKMWKLTKVGLVFNILTDDDKEPDKDLFFYNIERVKNICKKIAPDAKITLKKHSTRFEMHVYMYR